MNVSTIALPPNEWLAQKESGTLPEGALLLPPQQVYLDGLWIGTESPADWAARKMIERCYPEAVFMRSL